MIPAMIVNLFGMIAFKNCFRQLNALGSYVFSQEHIELINSMKEKNFLNYTKKKNYSILTIKLKLFYFQTSLRPSFIKDNSPTIFIIK